MPHVLFISYFYSSVSTCRLTLCVGDSLPSFPKIKPETQEAKSGAHFASGSGGAGQAGVGGVFEAERLDCGPTHHKLGCNIQKFLKCASSFCFLYEWVWINWKVIWKPEQKYFNIFISSLFTQIMFHLNIVNFWMTYLLRSEYRVWISILLYSR